MSHPINQSPDGVQSTSSHREQFIFWNIEGKIIAHLLYKYFKLIGFGKFFPDGSNKKNSESIIVRINGNVVCPVNIGYLLEVTKNYIVDCTEGRGICGAILDSLHSKISLFSDKNLKLLPTLELEFVSDTRDCGYFFFRNGIVKVDRDEIKILRYDEFEQYVWENSIVQIDFEPIELTDLKQNCDFMKFIADLTVVDESQMAQVRYKALSSAIGYLLHRFKDAATTKSIILMDVFVNGLLNGGSGKTLLINAVGKIRNLSIIDGKKYDQKEWFGLSSVELNTEVLLFDDVEKNFNFEQIFPLMTTGMLLKRKYKNDIFVPFNKSPKVAITTNYAINGSSSSHRRRMYEFEVSATYSADFTPRDKFSKNFFDEWTEQEWNQFYNAMFSFLQVFLREGLVESAPINMQLTKLVNRSCEEFVEWANEAIRVSILYDKKILYDRFLSAYPEFVHRLKQREFTNWLKLWGQYKKFLVTESHSGDIRNIICISYDLI